MTIAILLVLAYLIGSIPTAVWVSKWVFGIDIREHGSGNAGATNAFRILGKKAGSGVMLADMLKGFFAEAKAFDVSESDHVCKARFAGHQAHLAKEVGRLDGGHHARHFWSWTIAIGVDARADLGATTGNDIQPVGDGSLTRDVFTGGVQDVAHARSERAQFAFRQ